MSETKKSPRWTVMFVGHHAQPITDGLVKDLIGCFRPESVSHVTGEPATEKTDAVQFEAWRGRRDPRTVRFYYPKPHRPGESARYGTMEVVVGVRATAKFEVDNLGLAHIPLFEREKETWFRVIAGGTRIDYDSAFDMAWFFDKVQRAFPIFKPDFGFADVQTNVAKNMGDDPRRRVWPVLLYGPTMVEKLGGREHVLDAPVWGAEELSDGSLWLQVAENPFMATQAALSTVADYLGLES